MKKRFLFILLVSLVLNNAYAQGSKSLLKKADKEYNQLRFAFAIPYYKKYLKSTKADKNAIKNLANCYFKINQYDSAILYYEKAVQLGAIIDNQLGELYAVKGRYDLAIGQYQNKKEIKQTLLTDARLYGFQHLDQYLRDSMDYKFSKLNLNTGYDDFAAVPYKDGIVFVSNRPNVGKSNSKKNILSGWDGKKYTQLYYNNAKDSVSSFFSTSFINKLNTGSISFTSDFKQAYFTKNANKKGKEGIYQLEVWYTEWQNGNWMKPKKLFFNNASFSYFQPAITPDGKRLYYVSNDTSGYGGTDIYYVDRNNDGSWKSTQNVGQAINTAGNEMFPSFYDGTLFFSSNGHAGIGGMDIYRITKQSSGEMEVMHMGYPVNSSQDDFTFSLNGHRGYFTSNRNGNDDIFSFEYNKVMVEVEGSIILDSLNQVRPTVYLTQVDIKGRVVIVDSVVVDQSGKYKFKSRPNRAIQLAIKDAFGVIHHFDFNTSGAENKSANVLAKQIEPIQLKLPEEIIIARKQRADSIKANDLATMPRQFKRAIDSLATLSDDYTVLHHLFDQVYVMKEDLNEYYKLIQRVKNMKGKKIVIVSAADCTGDETYNNDLSKRRANRIYKTLSKLGDHEVVINAVGETELIQSCNETTQELNRYSYVFIVNK
jgi:tetratricopeptide (TPR) repeat protein